MVKVILVLIMYSISILGLDNNISNESVDLEMLMGTGFLENQQCSKIDSICLKNDKFELIDTNPTFGMEFIYAL